MSIKNVGKVGFGLMRLTSNPAKKFTQEEFNKTLKTVLDERGFPEPLFINGGEFYGVPDRHENIKKLGSFFREYPEYADQVYVSIKGGIAHGSWSPDVSPENLKYTFESIKEALQPLYAARKTFPATLDMFTLARVGDRPIEETVEELKGYQTKGYFTDLCLSEVGANTISKVAKTTKIGAVEIEFSLFVSEAAQNGVFETLEALHIPAVCYSPLGMGLLTQNAEEKLDKSGSAHAFDRFKEENWQHNKQLLEAITPIASRLHITPAKLSLSYITSVSGTSKYPQLIPIPGSTDAQRQLDNLKVVKLSAEDISEINGILGGFKRKGLRYNSVADEHMWN